MEYIIESAKKYAEKNCNFLECITRVAACTYINDKKYLACNGYLPFGVSFKDNPAYVNVFGALRDYVSLHAETALIANLFLDLFGENYYKKCIVNTYFLPKPQDIMLAIALGLKNFHYKNDRGIFKIVEKIKNEAILDKTVIEYIDLLRQKRDKTTKDKIKKYLAANKNILKSFFDNYHNFNELLMESLAIIEIEKIYKIELKFSEKLEIEEDSCFIVKNENIITKSCGGYIFNKTETDIIKVINDSENKENIIKSIYCSPILKTMLLPISKKTKNLKVYLNIRSCPECAKALYCAGIEKIYYDALQTNGTCMSGVLQSEIQETLDKIRPSYMVSKRIEVNEKSLFEKPENPICRFEKSLEIRSHLTEHQDDYFRTNLKNNRVNQLVL